MKNRVKILTLLMFVWIPTLLFAGIIETNDIEELEKYIDAETLVIFDIDNTLMEPVQVLGTDQWFHHRIDSYLELGLDEGLALEKAISEWMAVQSVTKVRLVEEGTADFVARLQDEGYTIMGLTTRGLGLSTRTIEQLKALKIDLSRTAPTHDELHFMNNRGVLFRKGILFTAGTHKGHALEKLLYHIKIKPKAVVFINDKEDHLTPVEEVCAHHGIPFVGLRYGRLDEKVSNFDSEAANIQWAHFGHILSDKAAKRILECCH